jgi:hypothetical protein
MRRMRIPILIIALIVMAAAGGRAQQPQFGAGPPAQYSGYAFVECTAANAPAVRLVLMQGVVPAALPAAAPRPSLAVVLPGSPGNIDTSVGKEIALSKDPAAPGIVSCPVVGQCVLAETGAVTIERRGEDGALTGQFRATWPPIPQRTGKFTVAWRDSGKTCGS